jgi:tetratricopeptide (TPR) repeat protein
MTSSKKTATLSFVFAAIGLVAMLSAGQPVRIEPAEANRNLVKKVEPTFPLMEKLGIGGKVVLEATISREGKISTIKAISGHPMLISSVIDAVRQWEYKPFLQGGQPIAVITRVEWSFPSPARTKSEEAAQRDYYPAFQTCFQLVHAQKYVEAEKQCSQAVQLADQLPPQRVLERSSSRTFLGHALLDQGKTGESIPVYEKAVAIRATTEDADHDADFAQDNANLARAYFLAGQLKKADPLYARAITIFEAAIVALPDMKDHYIDGLRTTLLEYAKLKDTSGEPERARELAQKAAALTAR